MKQRILSLVLALSLLLSLSACGTAKTAAPSESVLFVDDCDREVALPTQIERIVPSSAMAQIILYAIAPDLMVGLANKWDKQAEGILAQEHFSLPEFGNLYSSADLNIEELASSAPQLLLDIGAPKASLREDLDTLQAQTNIPCVFLSTSLEDMPETYRKLGALLGREEKAEQLAQFCERVYDRTRSIMTQVADERVKALYILGEDGLNVLAKGSYHAELVDLLTDNLAVVDNPVSKGSGNAVTMEQIALWDPDVILFGPESIYASVTQLPAWNQLKAITSGSYIQVPNAPFNWMNMPPSAQRYLGLIWLTAELYPTYCDYDVKAEIMEYYELFYGCELSEEQFASITAGAFLQ